MSDLFETDNEKCQIRYKRIHINVILSNQDPEGFLFIK